MVFYLLESGECLAPAPCSVRTCGEGAAPLTNPLICAPGQGQLQFNIVPLPVHLKDRWACSMWDVIMLQNSPAHIFLSEEDEAWGSGGAWGTEKV